MKALFQLALLAAAFAASFYFGRLHEEDRSSQSDRISHSFTSTPYPLENRKFAVIVIGCNNGASVEKTIQSIGSQVYSDYRLIYIDDGSNDGSDALARDLISQKCDAERSLFIRNETRVGHLANVARAIRLCADEEIAVIVNGDDWLAHEWVLNRLNQYYAHPDLWLTYGQYREFPTYSLGHCQPVAEQPRTQPFCASHLKTFYAALFKQIAEADLLYQGNYYPAAGEMAYMFPMLEMAQEHSAFLSDSLYIANRGVFTSKEEREIGARCEKSIRNLTPYSPIARLQTQKIFDEAIER